jgi:hypothetical protein
MVLFSRNANQFRSLFCRLAELGDGDAVNEAVDRCSDEV